MTEGVWRRFLVRDPADVLLSRVLEWARRREDVRAVLRTGSRARADGPGDRYSDQDIELFLRNPARLEDGSWLREIGDVWVAVEDVGPCGNPAFLAFFDGPAKVDFQVLDVGALARPASSCLSAIHSRGVEVLLDKDGLTGDLRAADSTRSSACPPSQVDLMRVCSEFWFEVMHIPGCVARSELWSAKLRDAAMKACLLRLIEWDAIAVRGPETDTWYNGTRMALWATSETYARLQDVFGRWDTKETLEAARACARLVQDLTLRVATSFDLDHEPLARIERRVMGYLFSEH